MFMIILLVLIIFIACFLIGFIIGLFKPIPTEIITEYEPDENILQEIEALKVINNRLNIMAKQLEKDLQLCSDKERTTILNKLNTIDKQTLSNHKKINKLKEQL